MDANQRAYHQLLVVCCFVRGRHQVGSGGSCRSDLHFDQFRSHMGEDERTNRRMGDVCCFISRRTKSAAVGSGGIYKSADSGGTWTQTSARSVFWYSVASSSGGTKWAAASHPVVFTPRPTPGVWTQTSAPITNLEVCCVLLRRDQTGGGGFLVGGIYTSHQFGCLLDTDQRAGYELVIGCFIRRREQPGGGGFPAAGSTPPAMRVPPGHRPACRPRIGGPLLRPPTAPNWWQWSVAAAFTRT